MSCRWLAVVWVGLLASVVWAEERPRPAPSLADQIAAIKKAQLEHEKAFMDELYRVRNDSKAINRANEEHQAFTRKQADKLMALIRAHGKEPAALDGVIVLLNPIRYYLPDDLVELVQKHHLAHPHMGQLCWELRYRSEAWAEKILSEVAARHPQRSCRGKATYALGDYHRYQAQPWGREPSAAEKERSFTRAVGYYTEVTRKYADVRTPDGRARLGDKAAAELVRIKNVPNLQVGKAAPPIEGEDLQGKKMRLSDYRGKVVVLDFWGHW